MKYEKMKNLRPWEKNPKQYLLCRKHSMVFLEGCECPDCERSQARNIFDPWEPSVEQDQQEETYDPLILSMVAAAAGEKIPMPGVYKLEVCPLHNLQYVVGLNECPECKCWSS